MTPELIEELGDERYVIFDVDAPRWTPTPPGRRSTPVAADDALLLPEDKARFTVRLPMDAPVTIGDRLSLSINCERLYFFDPDTGEAL